MIAIGVGVLLAAFTLILLWKILYPRLPDFTLPWDRSVILYIGEELPDKTIKIHRKKLVPDGGFCNIEEWSRSYYLPHWFPGEPYYFLKEDPNPIDPRTGDYLYPHTGAQSLSLALDHKLLKTFITSLEPNKRIVIFGRKPR